MPLAPRLGTMTFGEGTWGADETASRAVFDAYRGAGGNFVDTADIHRALDGSLKRLGTDYIDLYRMHVWDGVTPVEEILQTPGDLVRAGKIRYFGFSAMPAWVAIKAAAIAQVRGIPGPVGVPMEYSLVARGIERAPVAGAVDGGDRADGLRWACGARLGRCLKRERRSGRCGPVKAGAAHLAKKPETDAQTRLAEAGIGA